MRRTLPLYKYPYEFSLITRCKELNPLNQNSLFSSGPGAFDFSIVWIQFSIFLTLIFSSIYFCIQSNPHLTSTLCINPSTLSILSFYIQYVQYLLYFHYHLFLFFFNFNSLRFSTPVCLDKFQLSHPAKYIRKCVFATTNWFFPHTQTFINP